MTDYRDIHDPRVSSARQNAYHTSSDNGTSIGGVLIGLAVIGLVFLALTLFFGNGGGNAPLNPTVEQSAPAATPAPADKPATTD